MCGICGKLILDGSRKVESASLERMVKALHHRGPDGAGTHLEGPVGLGHARLSILDLSPAGAQPMCNEDGTVWIVFNGEIYNFQELREYLLHDRHKFRSRTDTEVILHLYEELGTGCLEHLDGMFAFAIWDARKQQLFLARDRVGIKPLYYMKTGSAFLFASEIKAILAELQASGDVNLQAIDRFLTYGYLPGAETLHQYIQKLEPGHFLVANAGGISNRQYWDLSFSCPPQERSLDDAAAELRGLLATTVRRHMISDVPVGVLLSGGMDSTAVLSYVREFAGPNVQTFTIGFDGEGNADERPYARMAADHFGTVHRELTISSADFKDFLPEYVWRMEEPVSDPPAVALYYLARLAGKSVKVVLSGEGGDEAFGGYPDYRNYLALEGIKGFFGRAKPLAGEAFGLLGHLGPLRRFGRYRSLVGTDFSDYYLSRTATPGSYFNRIQQRLYTPEFAHALSSEASIAYTKMLHERISKEHLLNRMLYVDTKTWLPDDLLLKADKMTMASSLELRVPFLDHHILEFAGRLPPSFKVRGTGLKRVLRHALAPRVPGAILRRRKAGFPVPFNRWLLGELKDYTWEVLTDPETKARGYFQAGAVEDLLRAAATNAELGREVFMLLALEWWHRRFVACSPLPAVGPPLAVVV